MSIIFWNVRGAASKSFRRNTKELLLTYKHSIFIVVEPRISGEKADKMIKSLGFQHFTKSDARGFFGGIWVLWNESIGTVTVLSTTPQIITLLIDKKNELPWILSSVYANPTPSVREELWEFTEKCTVFDDVAWMVIGDFNQIVSADEHHDRFLSNSRLAQRMVDTFHSRGLLDLEASGPRFTWSNHHFGGNLVMKKLDRAVANVPWSIQFADALVNVLPKTRSDHHPILVRLLLLVVPLDHSVLKPHG